MKSRPLPRKACLALYNRTNRGVLAAEARRGTTWGIAVDGDRDACWWRAWQLAGLRQILAGAFGPISYVHKTGPAKTGRLDRSQIGREAAKPARASRSMPLALKQSPKTERAINPRRGSRQR